MIRQEESQVWERKRSLSLQREALEALCAMINAEPGTGSVVFGVEKDGKLVGVEPGDLDRAQQSLAQTIHNKFDPPIQASMEVVCEQNQRFLVLGARRNRGSPYHEFDGRAWIREGTTSRQLKAAEKLSLQRSRNRDLHNGPWRCDTCGSLVGMLSSVEVAPEGVRRTYRCTCGGEFWPAA